ncbi:MAG TPA: NlpC/P60 family protein [Spirochaetia bacterium]|nr:NlpC/P60 family protein [Spirochaetia bacterium]
MHIYSKCLLWLMVFSVLLTAPSVALGTVTQAQLNAAKQLEGKTQGQINSNSFEMNKSEAQLFSLKTSLAELDKSLANESHQINDQKMALSNLQSQEASEEAQRQKLVDQFNAILVNTYENGGYLNYLSVLLGSTSWTDFITRLAEVKMILLNNYDIQSQIVRENQIIQGQQAVISQNIASLQGQVNQYNQLAATKEQALSREQGLLSGLSSTQRQLEEEKVNQLAAVNDIQRELAAQEEEALLAKKYGPIQSTGQTPAVTQAIHIGANGISSMIAYAESYMGTPYVWGGTSPDPGFDCSGFTQYVLRHAGVSVQRTSEQQYLEGSPVSESNLEPGDLVFFSTYAPGASHVGIFVGNGLMVDAEDYGVVFDNISNAYWGPRYLGARRIVQP